MKKTLAFVLLVTFFVSCESENDLNISSNNETINGSVATKKLNVNQSNSQVASTLSTPSNVIDFNFGIMSGHGGCSYRVVTTKTTYMSDWFYGPSPIIVSGRAVRGYNGPTQSLNTNRLGFGATRKYVPVNDGSIRGYEEVSSGAISIEYPFQANKTYEIIIKGTISGENPTTQQKPTLYVELKNSGIIPVNDPCSRNELVQIGSDYNGNYDQYYKYCKSVILDETDYWFKDHDYIVKFSPTEAKNAILITLYPDRRGTPSPNLSYNYDYTASMQMLNVTINEKPFDSTVDAPVPGRGDGIGGRRN